MNKSLKRALWAAALFALLLGVLLLAEQDAPDGSIRSLSAALWYALTTLTTVGYGDLYPVTPLGRAVGALLQLGSLGLLALLIGVLLSFWRGRLRPWLLLRLKRGRDWYVFTASDEASRALAAALLAEDQSRVIVFSAPEDTAGLPGLVTELSLTELMRLRAARLEGMTVFFLSDDCLRNEAGAAELDGSGCRTVCLTPHRPEKLPEGQLRFSPWENCARLYWQRFPLRSPEETIVLVGDGRYARALLEQALLVNVVSPEQRVRYHLCGDYADFRRCHPALESLFAPEAAGDRLIAAEGVWNADAEMLRKADRIIFCDDREEETLEKLTALRRYFPVTGQVHARLSLPFDGAEAFGSLRELYTPELVLRARLDRSARALHELYRAANGGARWEELGDFARRSNLAAADHLAAKLRLLLPGEDITGPDPALCRRAGAAFARTAGPERRCLREIEHLRWARFYLLDNWRYAPERSNADRMHPMLLPFESLSETEQAKDDYAWELLAVLGEELPE